MNEQPTSQPKPETIYVLVDDDPVGIARFAGAQEIDADKLGQQLQKFSSAISRALTQVTSLAGEFVLQEIDLEAKFTAEFGFVFVSKAGVEGSVTLHFKRPDSKAG